MSKTKKSMKKPKLTEKSLAKLAAAKALRGEARKRLSTEKRLDHKLMNENKQAIKPGSRKAPGTRVNKYARELADTKYEAASDSFIADNYALALLNPMANTGAKLPDPWAVPSTAKHLEYEITVTPILDATSGYYYVGFTATDCLHGNYQVITASSAGTFTWGSLQDSPHYTTLSSYIDRYRLVSAMVRLENGTAAASLSGRAYTVQSTTTSGTVLGPGKIADVTASSSRCRSFQLNDINVTPVCRYVPFTNLALANTQVASHTPDQWMAMTDADSQIGLSIVCQLPANTAADFVFRVYQNFELVPLLGAQYVIPTSVEVAMPEDAVKARRTLMQQEEDWEGDLETAVKQSAKLARQVGKTVGALGRAASSIWSGVTGGFSGLTAKRQMYQAALGHLRMLNDCSPGHQDMIKQLQREFTLARRQELAGRHQRLIVEEDEKEDPVLGFVPVSRSSSVARR